MVIVPERWASHTVPKHQVLEHREVHSGDKLMWRLLEDVGVVADEQQQLSDGTGDDGGQPLLPQKRDDVASAAEGGMDDDGDDDDEGATMQLRQWRLTDVCTIRPLRIMPVELTWHQQYRQKRHQLHIVGVPLWKMQQRIGE